MAQRPGLSTAERGPDRALRAVPQNAVRGPGQRLPERDRMLLVGWDAYARGEADRAEAVYRRILDER